MRPDERDAAYLWDMLEAAKEVREFTRNLQYSDYLANRMAQLAVERQVEVIGEAARQVSDAFKAVHGDIPWRKYRPETRTGA